METMLLLASGVVLGLGHAFEADHVAAVSTLSVRSHANEHSTTGSKAQLLQLSAGWGLGHAVTLCVVGALLILFRWSIPRALEQSCEFMVALMLIALGIWAIIGVYARKNDQKHTEANRSQAASSHRVWRCFAVGVIHGVAGSAALLIFASDHLQSPGMQLAYIAVFGFGACAGMVVFSGTVLIPLCLKRQQLARFLSVAAASVSVGVGLYLGIKIALVDGLFM